MEPKKMLLGAGLAIALGFALLTSMGQAQADVIADARGDFVPGINVGDLGILPATEKGTWNYLASDNATPTLDSTLDVLGWNLPPFTPSDHYIFIINPSADSVSLRNPNLTAEEILVHPSASFRPPSFVVVRWIAGPGEEGLINITGNVRKLDPGGGGVTFGLFVDGISVFNSTLAGNDTVGVAFDHTLIVGAGATVDFVVGPRGGDANDSTALKATISLDFTVQLPPDLVIGENFIIGSGTTFEGGVNIGDNAQIGSNVQFKQGANLGDNADIGDETIFEAFTDVGNDVVLGFKVKLEEFVVVGDRVEIGDESVVKKKAMIGNDASIGDFVTIGDRAVIGAGAVIGDGAIVPAVSP